MFKLIIESESYKVGAKDSKCNSCLELDGGIYVNNYGDTVELDSIEFTTKQEAIDYASEHKPETITCKAGDEDQAKIYSLFDEDNNDISDCIDCRYSRFELSEEEDYLVELPCSAFEDPIEVMQDFEIGGYSEDNDVDCFIDDDTLFLTFHKVSDMHKFLRKHGIVIPAPEYKKKSYSVKKLRNDANLTQQSLSNMLGIPKRTIEDWEAGTRVPPEYVTSMIHYILKNEI